MHRALAICVLLATHTMGAPSHPLSRWLAWDPLPELGQPAASDAASDAAAANRNEAVWPAVYRAWSEAANDTGNTVMYFVQSKQELFVFGGAGAGAGGGATTPPASSAPVPSPRASAPSSDISTLLPPSAGDDPLLPSSVPSAPAPTTPPTTTSAPQPTSTIPPGYTNNNGTGSYYKIHKTQATWHEAEARCEREGARLLRLDDAAEARLAARLLHSPAHNYYATWTRNTDTRPGHYYEDRGGSVVYGWSDGDGTTERDAPRSCVVFSAHQTQLYRFSCDSTWHFICEIS